MNEPPSGAGLETPPLPPFGPSERFRVYELLWAKLNQEGDGIWSRFNIILALHVAMFGGYTFFFTRDPSPPLWREFSIGIAVLGVLASIWSLKVLHGLWRWHRHWKDQLQEFETLFPADWLRPHTTIPTDLPFSRRSPGSTQVAFFVLLVAWSILIGIAVAYDR